MKISVELIDDTISHCIALTFRGRRHPPTTIFIDIHQALELFRTLGSCLVDYFARESAQLLKRLGERNAKSY